MKNLKILYGYELRKILSRKLLWVTFGLLTAVVLLMTMSELLDTSMFYDETTGKDIRTSRYAHNQYYNEYERQASGTLLDEETLRRTAESKYSGFILENGITDEERKQNIGIAVFVEAVFPGRGEMPLNDAGQTILDFTYDEWKAMRNELSLAEILYGERSRVAAVSWENYCLSDGAKAYWQKQDDTLQTPFTWHYYGGWRNVLGNVASLDIMVLLLAAIALAGAFADENTHRTEQLVLSSRYGRLPLYTAKWLAGFTVVLVMSAFLVGLDVVVQFLLYGMDGAHAAIQLWMPFVARHLTFVQAALAYLGLLALAALLYSALTLFFSELLQSSTAVLAAVVGPLLFSYIFNIDPAPGIRGFLSQVLYLLPTKVVHRTSLSDPRLVPIPGGYLTNLQAGYVLYPLCVLLLAWGGWRLWRRHQVNAR